MKTKKTTEFKEKELQRQEARAQKKVVWAKGLERFKMRGNQLPVEEEDEVYLAPSSKDVGHPWGRAQSSRKHHPFLAMAAAAAQSAKAAKKCPHFLDGEEGVKQACKKLPSILLRKKVSTGGVKKPHHY